MIPGLKKFPHATRLKHVKLWTLEDRRIRADLIEVFKMVHGLSVVDVGTLLNIQLESYKRAHLEIEERSCGYRS